MMKNQESVPAVMPYLGVRDAAAAIEFYKRAFGAVEKERLSSPDGSVAHAGVEIGGSMIMLAEENPEWGNLSPASLGGTTVRLHLYVDDVDTVFARAIELGAKERIPLADQFYGDRSGRIEDPFGHQWILATRKEDVPREEMEALRRDDGGWRVTTGRKGGGRMTKELHCGEIMKGCDTVIRGETEDEVLKKGAQHAREAHGIDRMDDETVRAVKAKIREA